MILFNACPHCGTGDLILRRGRIGFKAECSTCSFVGELRSVYPPPSGRRSHVGG